MPKLLFQISSSTNQTKKTAKFLVKKLIKKDVEIKRIIIEIIRDTINTEIKKEDIKIQNKINNGFLRLSEKKLAKKLSELGHRFPNARAKFICEARKYKDNLKETLFSFGGEIPMREWLVKNLKGLGYKESSHFLRNIGYKNISIIDFHIKIGRASCRERV